MITSLKDFPSRKLEKKQNICFLIETQSYSFVWEHDHKFKGFSQQKTRREKTIAFSLKHSPSKINFKTINQFTN